MAVEADFWPPMEGGADTGKTCEKTAAENLIVHISISYFMVRHLDIDTSS